MKADQQPRINLLSYRYEEAERKRKSQLKVIVITAVNIFLVSAVVAAWWTQNLQIKALEQENRQLQEQVKDLSEIAAIAGGVSDQEVKELDLRKAWLDKLEEESTLNPKQLENIYALSVPNITIGKMEMKNGGEITVTAYTNTQADLITFLERLESEDFIKEVQKISSQRNDKTGEINFTLVLAGEVTANQ